MMGSHTFGKNQEHQYEITECGARLDHPSNSAPRRLLHSLRENELGVGSSGISGKMKGAVRRAESQGAMIGGGRNGRKGAAMSAR